jgi:hypothetical protein
MHQCVCSLGLIYFCPPRWGVAITELRGVRWSQAGFLATGDLFRLCALLLLRNRTAQLRGWAAPFFPRWQKLTVAGAVGDVAYLGEPETIWVSTKIWTRPWCTVIPYASGSRGSWNG